MRYFLLPLILFSSFIHASELNTKVTKQKLTIIALAPHIVETLFAIGAGEQIIGTLEHADFPLEAKSIPRVGNYARLQIEKILQLQPDIIIAWRTGNPGDDLQRLRSYGVNVVYSDPKGLADVSKEILLFGELTGRQQQAKLLAEDYSASLISLKKQYQQATPVSAFYELWSQPLRTVAGNSWLQQQLTLCGVENIFASIPEGYPQVSLETVIQRKPQVIIQPRSGHATSSEGVNWSRWTQIPAVKHQHLLHPDADKVHRMTYRMIDEIEKLCADIDKVRTYYKTKN